MVFVETGSTEGAVNLAFEEYFLKNEVVDDTVLMLWRNRPTVVVGAYQNTLEEVDMDYAMRGGIDVIRRSSGGGAVYHDLGNLCFTFIAKAEDFSNLDYGMFLTPVAEALEKLGMPTEISGRNDLTFRGRKISGSAVRLYRNKVLFHGTLLYDSDLEALGRVLAVPDDKIRSKGIKSVRARVTRIKPNLPRKMDIMEFRQALLETFFRGGEIRTYAPTEEQLLEIEGLAEEKYRSFAWNFGRNPQCGMSYSKRFPGGKVTACLTLREGRIFRCRFRGDFLGCAEIEEIERALEGVVYMERAVQCALENIDIGLYFGKITAKELLSCIMGRVTEEGGETAWKKSS